MIHQRYRHMDRQTDGQTVHRAIKIIIVPTLDKCKKTNFGRLPEVVDTSPPTITLRPTYKAKIKVCLNDIVIICHLPV